MFKFVCWLFCLSLSILYAVGHNTVSANVFLIGAVIIACLGEKS